jgi:hypothetical protein
MADPPTTVTTASELAGAVNAAAREIVVVGKITGVPSITLPEGTTLRGGELAFLAKGVRLTKDNTLRDITITATPYEVAVYNDTTVSDAGTLSFHNVSTVGQVYIVADDDTMKVRVETDSLHVRDADVRGRAEQPRGGCAAGRADPVEPTARQHLVVHGNTEGRIHRYRRHPGARLWCLRRRIRRPRGPSRRRHPHGRPDPDGQGGHGRRNRPRHAGQDLRRGVRRLRRDRGPGSSTQEK